MMTEIEKVYAIAVEDDEGSALLMQAILRRLGVNVNVHRTGENFIKFIHALPTPPNLIFLDIHLPRQSGLDIVKALRIDAKFADVTAIAVSAVNPMDFIPRAKEAGFNGFIAKPINRLKLPKQISRILAGEEVWEMR